MRHDDIVRLLPHAARRNTALFARCWLRMAPAAHQYEMARRFDGPTRYQADFWPRDHGKSTIFCIAGPLRRICEDPNIRILIVQKTATEAEKTLGAIRRELERNQALKSFYRGHWLETVGHADIANIGGIIEDGGRKQGAWTSRRIYVKRTRTGKDPTLEAVGVGGTITGGHYDLIILDDVEDDENTRTDARLAWLRQWFEGTILQLREPHTKIVIVGTLKTARRDIYNLIRDNPMWDVYLTGAILQPDPDDIEYRPIHNEQGVLVDVEILTPNVRVLWPQKWDARALILERLASTDPGIWRREKQNDLVAMQGTVFRPEWIRYVDPADAHGPWDMVIQAWDTAWTQGADSSWSVCVTVGIQGQVATILHVHRIRVDTVGLLQEVRAMYERYRPHLVVVERAASGLAVLDIMRQHASVPMEAVDTGARDKVTRARMVSPLWSAGQVQVVRDHWTPAFVDELTSFPESAHDDQVDAMVHALHYLFQRVRSPGIYV